MFFHLKKANRTKEDKYCAVVGSSEFNEEAFLACYDFGLFKYIIAVDGGYEYLTKLNVQPDLAIGDFDSLGYVPKSAGDKMRVEKFPAEKDYTDLELALFEAQKKGFKRLMLFSVLGGRLDQTASTIQLMAKLASELESICALGKGMSCIVTKGPAEVMFDFAQKDEINISAKVGKSASALSDKKTDSTFSVISLSKACTGISSSGLKWEYNNSNLTNDVSLGVSNVVVSKHVNVDFKEGTMLLVFSSDLII